MDRLVRGSRRFSVVLNSQVEVPVEPTLVQTLRQMRKDAVHGNVDYTQLQGLDQNLIHFLLTRDDRLAHKTIGKWRKYQNPERAYKAQKLRKTILTNMSVCTNSTQDWAETVRNCAKAVEIDAGHAKAHFLKGVAERNLHKYDDATVSIKTAIKLMPNDKKIREELARS